MTTHAIDITRQIEESLNDLEDAFNISKAGMATEGTADLKVGELLNTFEILRGLDGPKEKFSLLIKIGREISGIAGGIIQFVTSPPKDTVDVEPWPVVPKFPERVSNVCVEFCDSYGLNPVLRTCLEHARKTFSNIRNLYAELDYFRDDQPEDIGHVVMRVEVESDQETALKEYDAWVDWMITNITASESNFFTLTVRRV